MVNVHIHEFAPGSAVLDARALTQFQEQWTSYQKLVDNDYLAHREVAGLLHKALLEMGGTPFSFLDIACGDAGLAKAALAGTGCRHYHGIDLAEPAIKLAAANLAGAPYEVDLDHGDFVEAIADRPEPVDIAWCGLSMHHLKTEDKLVLLKGLRGSTLRFLMIYEPTRRDGESRDAWLERFLATNEPRWTALTQVEKDQIVHHIRTADLPETVSGWMDLGREAGFSRAANPFTDASDGLRLFRFDV